MYVRSSFIQLYRSVNNSQTRLSKENSRVGFDNFAWKFAIKYFIIPPFLHQQKISIRRAGRDSEGGLVTPWSFFSLYLPEALTENKKPDPRLWLDHKSSKTGQTHSSILSSQTLLMISTETPYRRKWNCKNSELAGLCYKLNEKYMMCWSGWDTRGNKAELHWNNVQWAVPASHHHPAI